MRFNVTILIGVICQALAQETIIPAPVIAGSTCTSSSGCSQDSKTKIRVNNLPISTDCSQVGGLCNRLGDRAHTLTSTSKRVYRAQPVFIQPAGPAVEAVATTTTRRRVPRYTNTVGQLPLVQPRPFVTQEVLPPITQALSEPIGLQNVPQTVEYVSQPSAPTNEINTLMVPLERKLTFAERRRLRRAARYAAQQGCPGANCDGCVSCGQNVNPAQVIQVPMEPRLTWRQRRALKRAARDAARTNCAATGTCPYHVVKQVQAPVVAPFVAAPAPALTETKIAELPAVETVNTVPTVEETTITLPSS